MQGLDNLQVKNCPSLWSIFYVLYAESVHKLSFTFANYVETFYGSP